MQPTILPATPADLPEIFRLLQANKLPPDGIEVHLATTLVARQDGAIIGTAALELYDDAALLRSVAVDAARRGAGLGQRLTRAALDLARARAVTRVYLLTTTAGGFFPRFGFRSITRDDVAPAVKASVEFKSACPVSATVMAASL